MTVSHSVWGPFEQEGWEQKRRNEDGRVEERLLLCCLDESELEVSTLGPGVCMYVCGSRSVVSNSLGRHGLRLSRLLCPWGSPGKKTGVGCHSLLRGIFPTQGLNLGLPHCRQILYCLSHQRCPGPGR